LASALGRVPSEKVMVLHVLLNTLNKLLNKKSRKDIAHFPLYLESSGHIAPNQEEHDTPPPPQPVTLIHIPASCNRLQCPSQQPIVHCSLQQVIFLS
jgi:hypothetical protein